MASPPKIICIGLNYHDHALEQGAELPTEPLLFGKFASALIGPDEAIVLPPESAHVDAEAELAVVIGAEGYAIDKPVYDFVAHARSADTVRIPPADVVVVDGILLFVDARARDLCDVKVFVDADADVRLIRRIRRDMAKRGRPLAEILDQYLSTVQPMHLEFVEPSKRYADVIVPRGGHNPVAIEMIVAKIARRLQSGTE